MIAPSGTSTVSLGLSCSVRRLAAQRDELVAAVVAVAEQAARQWDAGDPEACDDGCGLGTADDEGPGTDHRPSADHRRCTAGAHCGDARAGRSAADVGEAEGPQPPVEGRPAHPERGGRLRRGCRAPR